MKKTLYLFISILIVPFLANSQTFKETRIIRNTALDVYDQYTNALSRIYTNEPSNYDMFVLLFAEEALVYNDIWPVNMPQWITPEDYYHRFCDTIRRCLHTFSNMQMSRPVLSNGKWRICCTFNKTVIMTDKRGYYYPEWTWYADTLVIEMDTTIMGRPMVFDTTRYSTHQFDNAKIVRVGAKEPVSNYWIIENPDKLALYDNRGSRISDFDKRYHSRMISMDRLRPNQVSGKHNDIFYNVGYKVNNEHFYTYSVFKADLYGINFGFDAFRAGAEMSDVNKKAMPDISERAFDFDVTAFYGWQLIHKNRSTLLFNAKLALDIDDYSFKGKYNTRYGDIDEDGENYERRISLELNEEKIHLYSIGLPLSFEYVLQLTQKGNNLYMSIEAGAMACVNVGMTYSLDVDARYTGYYSSYFSGVEFDHYYDYGNYRLLNGQFEDNVRELVQKYNYSLMCGLGMYFQIDAHSMIKISAMYHHFFMPPINGYMENFIVSPDKSNYRSLVHTIESPKQSLALGLSYIRSLQKKTKSKTDNYQE